MNATLTIPETKNKHTNKSKNGIYMEMKGKSHIFQIHSSTTKKESRTSVQLIERTEN